MPATTMDRKTFLATLLKSGLVPPELLAPALNELPESDRGRVLARGLVERGLLTRFQAELILAGRTDGFVLGQYRILDEIGRGGMGRVFKAEHQTMNRVVALKVLASSLTRTPRAQQLFQREVRAAAKLIHPNIVTAYDANEVDGRHYLVMEYVDGPNLQQLVKERGPLPIAQACDIVRQVAIGLQYAADTGLIHRDIKPSNLLVQRPGTPAGRGGVVKILDFGLARLTETGDAVPGDDSLSNGNGPVLGTPDYLSPEQARNSREVDIRSDLYSLGCTFYFLLTGEAPFPGGNAIEKLLRHTTEDPVPVEALRLDVPPAAVAVLRKLMAKDPAQRFQTPAEVAALLTSLSSGNAANWLTIDPSAAPQVLPSSGAEHPASSASPWAALGGDQVNQGTLGVDGHATAENVPVINARFQRPAESGMNRWFWVAVGAAVALVAVGLMWAL
jgi:serine/threonine-protein kinase